MNSRVNDNYPRSGSSKDEFHTYDNLNRLKNLDRGYNGVTLNYRHSQHDALWLAAF